MTMIQHRMLHLFGGRMDAYGLDVVRDGKMTGMSVRGQLTPELVLQHLEGTEGIGVYPMWPQNDMWYVKWGCCDIDTGAWSEAYSLATVLKAMGFTPFIERSRSKGWHVWVFSDGPCEARLMRRALLVAYATCDLQAREANPKAERFPTETQLGNYVRLPFKGGLAGPLERQTMMTGWDRDTDGVPVPAEQWLEDFTSAERSHPSMIQYWADKWKEPVRRTYNPNPVPEEKLRETMSGMPEDLFRFVADGPIKGDRSEALVALAWKLKQRGYGPDQAYAILCTADQRWGKYYLRPDGDIYLKDIIERTL